MCTICFPTEEVRTRSVAVKVEHPAQAVVRDLVVGAGESGRHVEIGGQLQLGRQLAEDLTVNGVSVGITNVLEVKVVDHASSLRMLALQKLVLFIVRQVLEQAFFIIAILTFGAKKNQYFPNSDLNFPNDGKSIRKKLEKWLKISPEV